MRRMLMLAFGLFFLWVSGVAAQVAVDENRLDDPAAEARARAIMEDIRCLVCQNQSIEESNALLAEDLRRIVRAQVAEGRNEAEIKAFLVERYGDWVLLDPPLRWRTALLWAGPFLLVLLGLWLGWHSFARARTLDPVDPLSEEERARLNRILNRGRDGEA